MNDIDESAKETKTQTQKVEKPKKKKKEEPKEKSLVSTFFRNALRSNLDLTSLADTKAGILISINGFILTVSVTASSFIMHDTLMTYAFIAIIVTSLGSIILAVLAVKPRHKQAIVQKEFLQEDYNSLLYFQDIAHLDPKEYRKKTNAILKKAKNSKTEMINHLHILASEIQKKYFWLKQAYTFFSVGLFISASIIIYALIGNNLEGKETSMTKEITKGNFYNIFEPSGATTLADGKILLVEDEKSTKALKLLEVDIENNLIELGSPYMPKKIKKLFKKSLDDLEAITADGEYIFTITSFSPNKDNKTKEDRERFVMLKYEDSAIQKAYIYKDLRKDLEKNFKNLFPKSFFVSSQINIEGLMIDTKKEILYIGFRAPLYNNNAILIGIKNYKEMFLEKKKPEFTKPIYLNLHGFGIRGLEYDEKKDGFWIIAGGVDNRNVPFELWFYTNNTKKLQQLNLNKNIGFSEGITLLKDDEKDSTLLLVEDNGEKPNKPANYLIIPTKDFK